MTDTESNDRNITWHHATVNRQRRQERNGHQSAVLWFTGLSGSGKSTMAHAVEEKLHQLGYQAFVLDGDNVRHALCADLGFSEHDRSENLRRIGEVCKLFMEAGVIILSAFISPFKQDRDKVRNLIPHGEFFEIFCSAPLEVCEQRDVKGLYKKARQGKIQEFTGVSAPYEIPMNPELVVDTTQALEKCVSQVMELLSSRAIFNP